MSDPGSAGGAPLLLALHSSGETLGVGLAGLACSAPPTLAAFPLGRALSNRLLGCIEEVLPASGWPRLARLAVATGPGGFTGTRLGVATARTLAQQLRLPLDGFSSFLVMARRMHAAGEAPARTPFWLVQDLPRRGPVAGLYRARPDVPGGIEELVPPRLHPSPEAILPPAGGGFEGRWPRLEALVRQPLDVGELLALAAAAAAAGRPAPWSAVVPLYPTSPVGGAA